LDPIPPPKGTKPPTALLLFSGKKRAKKNQNY